MELFRSKWNQNEASGSTWKPMHGIMIKYYYHSWVISIEIYKANAFDALFKHYHPPISKKQMVNALFKHCIVV